MQHNRFLRSFSWCLISVLSPGALAATLAVVSAEQPLWLVEQPQSDSPLLTARLPGLARVAPYQSQVTLMLSCHAPARAPGLELQIAAAELGFSVDAFEGPDASRHGPLSLTLAGHPGRTYPINGAYREAGRYQVGSVFAFGFTPAAADLADWLSDAARGETLHLSLPAAESGQPGLTAEFRLPVDSAALRQALTPCLSVPAP
ncbi:MAG: hypothetical protein V4812_13140 [Pseudomonadota bacterium]